MIPALKYKSEVGADGEVTLPRLSLTQGTPIEIIVLIQESEAGDQNGFRKLSAETMDYWDNSIDDKVWNNA
ncbi:MAG: hypothetical protein ACRYFS_25555 [Janthinobacterium lividum]